MRTLQFDQRWAQVVDGWMLVDDEAELADRIETLGDMAKELDGGINALSELQRATVKMMIETQVARGIFRGDFAPHFPAGTRMVRNVDGSTGFLPPEAANE